MRFVKADHQKERIVARLPQKSLRLGGEKCPVHIPVVGGIGAAKRIQPDPGRILERLPRGQHRHSVRQRRVRIVVLPEPGPVLGEVDSPLESVREPAVEVHFTDGGGSVAGRSQQARQRRFPIGQGGLQPGHADRSRITARNERLPRRRADRRVAERAVKAHSGRGQPIQIRRVRLPISVCAHDVRSVIVGANPKNVKPVGSLDASGGVRADKNQEHRDRFGRAVHRLFTAPRCLLPLDSARRYIA